MSYNVENFPKFVATAGKISVLTAVAGLGVFLMAFLFNAGTNELLRVDAQTATTTLTVLNTPPQWDVLAFEQFESSTNTPTNSGTAIRWTGTASDSNLQPYYLIVCSGNATPTAIANQPPACNASTTQWGVSTSTTSGAPAFVSTTTTEIAPFTELNNWFAWVCDGDSVNPRCNNTVSQGLNATNSSPFHVNRRPVFTAFNNTSPQVPGGIITFNSTSSDVDILGGDDFIRLFVCNLNDFSTTTQSCGPGGTIASTTATTSTSNASAVYTLPSVIQDNLYNAFGFVIDQHGHAALGGAQATNSPITVSNVAPTVANGAITINGGSNLVLTNPGGQTLGFSLGVTVTDANSCRNVASTSEVTRLVVSLFRTSVGSTTCNGSAGAYNPNNCYVSGVATTTWNLSCTASSTTCTGPTDPTVDFACSYPLWFLADPTDASAQFATTTWSAAVAGVDDNNATGSLTMGSSTVELISFPAINLLTNQIPYGALEPGFDTGTLRATTTMQSFGNTGLNQNLSGSSMCTNYSIGTPCVTSPTSTVNSTFQQFGTSSLAYGSGLPLSSTTPTTLQIQIPKTTATSSFSSRITYWGIAVPGTITLAGAYTGLNTFGGVVSASSTW